MTSEGLELLRRGADELGLTLSEKQEEQFMQLLTLLKDGNQKFNLTALKTDHDIVIKHFLDSLTCLRGGHLDGDLRVLDLGTGGGFPALPLAVMRPDLQITPLDSTRKKIEFVRATAETLGLSQVTPLVGRAETIGRQAEYRGQFDRVVARAVAALPILAELALPLLKVGGLLVAQKGPITPEELRAGRRAADEVGGLIGELDEFQLPLLGDARTLITIEKIRATPELYPRREGVPNAQPLFWKAK